MYASRSARIRSSLEDPPAVGDLDLRRRDGLELRPHVRQHVAEGGRVLVGGLRRPRPEPEAGPPAGPMPPRRLPACIGAARAAPPRDEGERRRRSRSRMSAIRMNAAGRAGRRRLVGATPAPGDRSARCSVVARIGREAPGSGSAGRSRPDARTAADSLGDAATGRIERDPAEAREVHLDPGVGGGVRRSARRPSLGQAPGQEAWTSRAGMSLCAEQDRHQRRVVLAVALTERRKALGDRLGDRTQSGRSATFGLYVKRRAWSSLTIARRQVVRIVVAASLGGGRRRGRACGRRADRARRQLRCTGRGSPAGSPRRRHAAGSR